MTGRPMKGTEKGELICSILDPTGNITALVEHCPEHLRQETAAAVMRRFPEVEQVGFFRAGSRNPSCGAELFMAGGEFCGNASMSAAALALIRARERGNTPSAGREQADGGTELRLLVSGVSSPVEVRLKQSGSDRNCFFAGVLMPPAVSISMRGLRYGGKSGSLPVVEMEGISHIVIEPSSPFFDLKEHPAEAETAVRSFCGELGADGLGLMFLEEEGDALSLTPLVYIPGSGTVFWENSCASGSSACGMYLSAAEGRCGDRSFREPGGTLRVTSDPQRGETWLYGTARLVGTYRLPPL